LHISEKIEMLEEAVGV